MSEISWESPGALRQVVPSAEHLPAVLPNFRQSGLASQALRMNSSVGLNREDAQWRVCERTP